jgi:hypothetical protein
MDRHGISQAGSISRRASAYQLLGHIKLGLALILVADETPVQVMNNAPGFRWTTLSRARMVMPESRI